MLKHKPRRVSDSKRGRSASVGRKRVLLVGDHLILRKSLCQLINLEPDLKVCAQADNSAPALEKLKTAAPNLVVVDVELKRRNGYSLIKQIKAFSPQVPVLVLSVHDEVLYVERALRAGAQGYVMKQSAVEDMMDAIRHLLEGQRYLSPQLGRRLTGLFPAGLKKPKLAGTLSRTITQKH